MRCFLVLLTFGTELMNGASLRSTLEDRRCGSQFEALRFVSTPQGSRLPLYWDAHLISYLTQTYRGTQPPGPTIARPVVLTLYSARALMFRRGPYVFVTTGLLAQIEDERELVLQFSQFRSFVTLAGRRVPGQEAQALPYCGPILAAEPAGFESVWTRFKDSLERYEAGTHLRLKRRPSEPAMVPSTELVVESPSVGAR